MAKKKHSPASTKKVGSVDPTPLKKPLENPLEHATRLIDLERAQVGHEIHDALLPLIFAASARLHSLAADDKVAASVETREKLRQAAEWLDEAMQVGRRILTQVYPPELVEKIWSNVARDTLERLFGETSSSIQWQIDPATNETSPLIATAAYRIVVEAVRNAIRHGKASEITVLAEQHDAGIRILIQDNGCGFDPTRVAQDRFGIRTMFGRAQLAGGQIAIDSKIGGPTKVTFTS